MTKDLPILLDLHIHTLPKPRIVRNVNGTTNKNGQITEYVDLDVRFSDEDDVSLGVMHHFYFTDLGTDLGYPWIVAYGKRLNWKEPDKNPTLLENPQKVAGTTSRQQLAEAAHDKTE